MLPIAVVSDVVWQALIAAAVTLILARMQRDTKKAVKEAGDEATASADAARVRTEEVRRVLSTTTQATGEKLDGLAKVAKDTHTLVNNNMGVQLRLNAELSRWKADQTKHPEDAAAADAAERLYAEHVAKQAVVDGEETKP
jgi:hypothetical protein